MAVKDGDECYSTESLILSKPRRHFRTPTGILVPHWQLCSLISAEKRGHVYYLAGRDSRDVVRLDTSTAETETVKRLDFQPKCLIAQYGWICCGGEEGKFSAIQLEESSIDCTAADAPIPLGLMLGRREEGYMAAIARARANKDSKFIARSRKLGNERVNCVTLWFPPTLVTPFRGAYDQPIAVLANNDKNVHIAALPREEAAEERISYPDCVNRAVVSPDGRILAAVCDDPYLYVHERVEKDYGSRYSSHSPSYEWRACSRIFLKSQKLVDKSDERGSFAICFSSTGKYLAVGTQYGHISIFDVGTLSTLGPDAIIADFSTTRPNNIHGAVRDMAFSPGPYDLLAWTEDRGRVGVADLRRGFTSRQVLHLDKSSDFERLSTTDKSTIDPRLLSRIDRNDQTESTERAESFASNFVTSIDQLMDFQYIRRLANDGSNRSSDTGREPSDRHHAPFSADETSVLDALMEQRRRREQREQRAAAARDYDEGLTRRARMGSYGSARTKDNPIDITGLSWSEDGQILYIGALNGIYEFHVNTFARKLFPSITMR